MMTAAVYAPMPVSSSSGAAGLAVMSSASRAWLTVSASSSSRMRRASRTASPRAVAIASGSVRCCHRDAWPIWAAVSGRRASMPRPLAHQRGERVNVHRLLLHHLIAGGHQHPQRLTGPVIGAGTAQPVLFHRQNSGRDGVCVQRVGLADAVPGFRVHPGCFDHLVSALGGGAGEFRPVGGEALDHPESFGVASTQSASPGDRAGNALRGGRELLAAQHLPGCRLDHGIGVCLRVGIHADDERTGMRDDSHCGSDPSFDGTRARLHGGRRRPRRKSLRGSTVTGHDR